MKKVTLILCAGAFIVFSCNSNEPKDSVEKADSINKAKIDSPQVKQPIVADAETSSFLVNAANGGMTEVQLADMAQQKGVNQSVKDFAAMMLHDHGGANEQVKTLASQRNVTLPMMISDENKKKVTDMTEKKGRDFDKAFMNAMVKDHEATIDMFEKSADKVNDTDVKTFINNTLPVIKGHLDSAKAIQKRLK